MNRLFIICLAVIVMLAGLVIGAVAINRGKNAPVVKSIGSEPDPNWRDDVDGKDWLTQFTLTERSGRKFSSTDLAGQVHVVNFFFAKCPTSCRMQSTAVQSLQNEFGTKGVVFLSITCDPKNDTPVALAQYAQEFQADPKQWLFLTGNMKYLERVGAEMYFVPVKEQAHSESLLVLDRAGKIRGRFSWKDAAELAELKKLLTELLAEPAGAPTKLAEPEGVSSK